MSDHVHGRLCARTCPEMHAGVTNAPYCDAYVDEPIEFSLALSCQRPEGHDEDHYDPELGVFWRLPIDYDLGPSWKPPAPAHN